jgi:pimeloyl-ACP methyl ester carboxylesterase
MEIHGQRVWVEESRRGATTVVFEAGLGFGRASWDRVVPLLGDVARTVAYDRPGLGRSAPAVGPTSIGGMADLLCGLIDGLHPKEVVLVGHSMGGWITRLAAPQLGPRLRGLLLLDPVAEWAAYFDDEPERTRREVRPYGLVRIACHVRPIRWTLARILSRPLRDLYAPATLAAIRDESFKPACVAQSVREAWAMAEELDRMRVAPPPSPTCPVVLLAAQRTFGAGSSEARDLERRQLEYVATLPNGRFERVDSGHLVQAEQPGLVAERVRQLVGAT